jgi:REP element-mobilizing transposase RayT
MALNAMPDHVHLCVQAATRLSPSEIAQRAKGVSSRFVHCNFAGGESFRWQEGYGVFNLSRSHVASVVKYIQGHKEHHAADTVWTEWEETDEPCEALPSEGRLAEGPQDRDICPWFAGRGGSAIE